MRFSVLEIIVETYVKQDIILTSTPYNNIVFPPL